MTRTVSRRLLVPGILAVVAFAVLMSLGFWQVSRLQWKEALIARVESRLADDPVPAPGPDEWDGLDIAAAEYTPVRLSGRFLNQNEVHVVFSLTEPKGPVGGIGYMVMTPFETDDGWLVYVNRGFVPQDRKDASTRAEGLVDGETTVTGLMREPQQSSWFMPGDDIPGNAWFSRDPEAYAIAYGLPADTVAPYIVDALAEPANPGGLPQGGETPIVFPNSHLQYAVTWFGLAAALFAVFVAFVLRERRR